jgi:hypothetical protein
MTLISEKPLKYECNKCKISIKGGFIPTGFCFPPCNHCFGENDHTKHLCIDCYKEFWIKFGIIQKDFIKEFLNEEYNRKDE